MKRKGKLISFLCCVAAVCLLAGIYFARRMYSTAYTIAGLLCFAATGIALTLSVMIYIKYYVRNYK